MLREICSCPTWPYAVLKLFVAKHRIQSILKLVIPAAFLFRNSKVNSRHWYHSSFFSMYSKTFLATSIEPICPSTLLHLWQITPRIWPPLWQWSITGAVPIVPLPMNAIPQHLHFPPCISIIPSTIFELIPYLRLYVASLCSSALP